MSISIIHIGLPLEHTAIPLGDAPKIAARLASLKAQMRAAGYIYEILHASPETGLDDFAQRLRTQRCDGVLVGGGVASDEQMRYFLEQIIDVTRTVSPQSKIMFHSHAVEVLETVRRWFPSPTGHNQTMPLTTHEPIAFIPTLDAKASRAFYEKTLGLTFEYDDNFAMVFRVGTSKIMLRVIRVQGDFTPQPFGIFGWESPDVAADVKALTAAGIKFLRFGYFQQDELGIWTAPNGNQVAWFKDPDGNTLSISNHN